jgi:hypothetical protein
VIDPAQGPAIRSGDESDGSADQQSISPIRRLE